MIKLPKGAGINAVQGHLPGQEPAQRELDLPAADLEERWTGAYIFENEWQSFRTSPEAGTGDDNGTSHVHNTGPLHHRREGD